ncbi:hypothetical protein [Endozoicomonas sp. GU-1]|uniref:lipopolysaccharide biosynthesis protein n=1 Tax=Endozoicomonas sp. GU-1 TaxID=3009078 RepID=UPI0022B31039|nr:hypothetical protein [Endozoicomonas sp. GU-1]WBA81509.1 hypothetical protein O2T12_25090 [Endozoicomonas sp. GU-1]WBA84457.1 hypothetical protein O3276_14250 [Endozoicomonas sp. GU-1]
MKRNVILSVIDQGGLSAFNFSVNVILIRVLTPENYGLYSLLFALGLTATSIQNALINTPLSVRWSRSNYIEKIKLESSLSLVNTFFLIIVFILSLLLSSYLSEDNTLTVAIALYITSVPAREFIKSRFFSKVLVQQVINLDVIFVLLSALLIFLSYFLYGTVNLISALMSIAVAGYTSAFYGKASLKMKVDGQIRTNDLLKEYVTIWQESRWSLVGVVTTELQNRGYIFIVSLFFGNATLALLQAGRVIYGPLNLLTAAWGKVSTPYLSGLFFNSQLRAFQKYLLIAGSGFILFNLIFGIILYTAWPYLEPLIYGGKYSDIAIVVFLWAVVTVLIQVRSTGSVGVQAMNCFKPLAFATIYGSLVSGIVLLSVCLINQPIWAIFSLLSGEMIALFYIVIVIKKYINEQSDEKLIKGENS